MHQATNHRSAVRLLLALLALTLAVGMRPASAAEDITGDWDMMVEFSGSHTFATLSITQKPDGALAGKWGREELSGVKFDGQQLRFVRTVRWGNDEFTLDYTGTLQDGKLTGTLSGDNGDFSANGVRIKPKPAVEGVWDLAYTLGDRDITARLTVSDKRDGVMDAQWTSQMGESVISNVKFEDGKLTFNRTIKFNDREFQTTFEATALGDRLTGTSKSEMGEIPVVGTRFGTALIGKWELSVNIDQGVWPSTLTIYPDLTGRQEVFGGEVPIKNLQLEGDQVTYVLELGFGDRTFVINHKLKLQDKTLNGQNVSDRGTNDVAGKKLEQPPSPASLLVGRWEFTRETPQGNRTNVLIIKPDMTATYSMRNEEIPVTDLMIEANHVSFKVATTFNDQPAMMEFDGTIEGDSLKGEFALPRRTREAVGKKVE